MKTEKPVEKLYTDTGSVDKKELVDFLESLVSIQRDSKRIIFRSKAKKNLTNSDKVVLYFMAKKLLAMSDEIEENSTSASEIKKQTGIKAGSVDSAFNRLRKDNIIVGSNDEYEIPVYKIEEVMENIKNKL